MAPLRILLPISLALIAGCGAAGAVVARSTLHVERRHRPDTGIPITITARDGVLLCASWSVADDGLSRCVVVMHGVGDSRGSAMGFAPMFLHAGYAVLAPDSRGHGDSGGDLVTYGLVEKQDTLAWAHWMRSNGCERIYGLGESMGAAVLIHLAAIAGANCRVVAATSRSHRQRSRIPPQQTN